MRKLKTYDIPVLCRSLKKIGAKDKIRAIAKQADSAADVWEYGFDFVWDIFDMATEKEGETAIYDFLAGPFEMKPEEVRELDMDVLFENLTILAKENNLPLFFKNAAKLMK